MNVPQCLYTLQKHVRARAELGVLCGEQNSVGTPLEPSNTKLGMLLRNEWDLDAKVVF